MFELPWVHWVSATELSPEPVSPSEWGMDARPKFRFFTPWQRGLTLRQIYREELGISAIMGFQDVFLALQEVFPQVDFCMREAVALQYPEDVNAAFDFILNDVLPSEGGPLDTVNSSDFGDQVEEANALLPSEAALVSSDISCNYDCKVNDHSTCMEEPVGRDAEYESMINGTSYLAAYPVNFAEANSSVHPSQRSVKFGASLDSDQKSDYLQFKSTPMDETLAVRCLNDLQEVSACSTDPTIHYNNGMQDKYADAATFNCAQETLSTFENNLGSTEHMDLGRIGFSYYPNQIKEFQSKHTIQNGDDLTTQIDMLSLDVNCQPTPIASGSNQAVSIDCLEDLIVDAKNSKEILASAMESTITMAKDLEFHEERVEQAKLEASMAGGDIIAKVEELQRRLKLERKTNDMHSEEIYGERSLLVTEAKELQSRLLSLSDERDKSLRVIDEIQNTLEARLFSAKVEIAAAEEEKLEKERLVQKALNEEELVMESIIEKSKKLRQEAEENSKLKEILMDHGQAIDILQEEIATICKDVMALKERVDGNIPLSRSVSSYRFGDLSSSTSFSLNSTSDRVASHTELVDCPIVTSEEAPKCPNSESASNIDEVASDDNIMDLDDWEFLEKSSPKPTVVQIAQ
ncbi:hypothetical protein J5N97_013039 [Dioscorea zingiberensis]|uniref:Uncharacterized protein n=1 Tax=Dioscorea zingiberensis TaxID=325984 RepID=A0A9D5HIA7_9LILI|nr:hypothetical protein J5N97_013039 [Dioscorea zingiberensis]